MFSKKSTIFLSALLSCALGCILAGALLLGAPKSAYAETHTLSDESTATLFLPSSYEQYLKLNSPSSVAINEKHIAIADGKIIYVYDKTNPAQHYRTYTYEGGEGVTVGKMQFSKSDKLYFLSSTGLYELSLGNEFKETKVVDFTPYTFLIEGNTLFAVTANEGINTAIYSFEDFESKHWPLDLVTASKSNTNISNNETANHPLITLADDVLYCAIGDNISRYDSSSLQLKGNKFFLDSSNTLVPISICATDGALYYTTQDRLYRSDLNGQSETIVNGSSFGALTEWNGNLYVLQDKAVLEYNIATKKITDFEIAASSSSFNRLNTATDCVRAGTLLVTADTGNNRISVYDLENKSFELLSCEGITHVATDGTIIAATTDNQIFIFEKVLNVHTLIREFSCTQTISRPNVEGVACVYGTVYFVTKDYHYGKIVCDANSENTWSDTSIQRMNDPVPQALTNDLYGNLYVAYTDATVTNFTEEQFATQNENGTKLNVTVPADATSLRADFQGNLYYLKKGKMYCNGEEMPFAEIDGKDFVYTGEESKTPVSFALGFEDDEVYFLFGNFIVRSNAGALGFTTSEQFSDAKDIVRAGDLLVTAHMDNRISVYDRKKHSFSFIQTDFSPTLVATDGSVIAAASGNKVYVCNYGDNCFGDPTIADLGTIKGLACVHGNVYYITQYGYGKVEEDDFGLVSRLEGSLEALAADANGILYVVDVSGRVRYFYEEEFIDPEVISGGDAGITLQMPLSSLRADRQGNLYYIHNNEIWKNDSPFFKIDDTLFAYGDERELTSFALGFEDDQVFLLYGSRIIKTSPGALDIPHMDQSNALSNHFDILATDIRRKRS